MEKTPKGTDYEIIMDGAIGCATVAPREYYDGSEISTLPIYMFSRIKLYHFEKQSE